MNKHLRFTFNAAVAAAGTVLAVGAMAVVAWGHSSCADAFFMCIKPDLSVSDHAMLFGAAASGTVMTAMGVTGYIGRDKLKPNMIQRGVAALNHKINPPRTDR